MQMKQLVVGLALAAMPVAQANDLAIITFDRAGRLTFQEVPAALAYRVEWTTNLSSPAWSSEPPGLFAIAPLGAGSQTVTVGVARASCFYRVVATVTNRPPEALASTFDLDSEAWRIVSYPFRSHSPSPATQTLPHDSSFGNPAGSVRVGDVYAETGIAAPAAYLGSKAGFYGGELVYDIYLRYTDAVTYPAVVLNGGSMSLYYDAPSPPVNAWQRRVVPLTEAGWKVSGTGANATESEFKNVLGSLVGLYIYTEWHTGADDTNVDNITLTPP